jgi:hypothetical protein
MIPAERSTVETRAEQRQSKLHIPGHASMVEPWQTSPANRYYRSSLKRESDQHKRFNIENKSTIFAYNNKSENSGGPHLSLAE